MGRLWSLAPDSYRPLFPTGTFWAAERNTCPSGTLEPVGGGGVRGGFAPPSPTLHLYLLGELGGQTEATRWRGARARLGPSTSGTAFCTGRRGNAAGRQRVHVDACVHQAQGHAGHRATKTRCNLADFPFVLHFSSLMFGGFCWLFFFFLLSPEELLMAA